MHQTRWTVLKLIQTHNKIQNHAYKTIINNKAEVCCNQNLVTVGVAQRIVIYDPLKNQRGETARGDTDNRSVRTAFLFIRTTEEING